MKTIQMLILAAVISLGAISCGGGYYVTTRPSPPYYERPIRPGPDYVWIDGEWVWSGNTYTYTNGYWAAPRPYRTWVVGEWRPRGNGWYWRRGRWH
jgi:hypothetical protein